ncbi:hypothetical protein VP01_184g2 [Puccinia sorghi]|uniref:Uncharacterized protein n=1 Tax=Puccinia sorghi TaxID=27349 RepID=A0A0L6VDQ8_9BASI|nr:hypothetical protein VP01_184g2 [Puccinia sorghi]
MALPSQCSQIFGLPPRPSQTYQRPNRRRPHKKGLKPRDQENQRAAEGPPRPRNNKNHHQPLRDASNMTSLHYVPTPSLTWNLPAKPSFVISPLISQPLFTPISRTLPTQRRLANPDLVVPFHSPHFQPLRTVQAPQVAQPRSCNPTRQFIDTDLNKTDQLTPKTRRKLAVEGMRKAVSDAALRKMGIHAGFGWGKLDVGLDQPITFTPEKQKPLEVEDTEKLSATQPGPPFSPGLTDQESDLPHPSYSPRQYTPKPLLLPCKLARSSNTIRSPPPFKGPLVSRQRTISYHRSQSPSGTCFQIQLENSMSHAGHNATAIHAKAEDLVKPNARCSTVIEDGSTTPSDCSFTSDQDVHCGSAVLSQMDIGSTTPCDSSFASDDQAINMATDEEGVRCESPEERPTAEDASFGISESDQKTRAGPNKLLDAIVWTIAAPPKSVRDAKRPRPSMADHPHRKSMGYWLGATVPFVEQPRRHHRATSETVLVQRTTNRPDSCHGAADAAWASRANVPSCSDHDSLGCGSARVGQDPQHEVDLAETPVAHPTFILPNPYTSNGLFSNLRTLASPPSLWSPLLRHISTLRP